MKKWIALLALTALLLSACGAAPASVPESEAAGTTAAASAPAAADGYALEIGGVRLVPGAALTDTADALFGAPQDVQTAPSCIHDGDDTLYIYADFELVTSPGAAGETIASVAVLSEAIATAEGVRLGDGIEAALAAYGDAYSEAESAPDFGRYVFVRGATSITMMTDGGGAVTAIAYAMH